MGVNQQVFERYVNGDETALMGMPVQKQIKFRELRNVLSRFFGDYPERMKPEFAIALIDDQCFLMDKCNRAIEELDAEKLYKLLNERKEHDLTLRSISDNYLTSLDDDSVGNRYDEKQDRKTKLEKKIASYSEALDKCNKILRGKVTTFYDHKIYKIVCFPLLEINNLPTAEEDSLKIIFLAKLFSLRCFFASLKFQLAQQVILARMKKNSNAAIARVLETDTKKLDRMVKSYEKTMNDAVSENGFLMAEEPMRAADAQEKLFTERKNKPEYEFVGYLLSHQDSEALQGFHSDLMREFLQTENYLSFALALCDIGRDADRPTDVYLFKLYMTNIFLKEYDYTITPVYDSLKRLGVKDDLIRCVLYEGSKEFKKRIERVHRSA